MRTLLAAALLVAPVVSLAAPAEAYCDPRYRPLCVNECTTRLPDVKDPLEYLTRFCPD